MFTERTHGLLSDCEPAAEALNGGYHFAYREQRAGTALALS